MADSGCTTTSEFVILLCFILSCLRHALVIVGNKKLRSLGLRDDLWVQSNTGGARIQNNRNLCYISSIRPFLENAFNRTDHFDVDLNGSPAACARTTPTIEAASEPTHFYSRAPWLPRVAAKSATHPPRQQLMPLGTCHAHNVAPVLSVCLLMLLL